jgi:hypothetical protein
MYRYCSKQEWTLLVADRIPKELVLRHAVSAFTAVAILFFGVYVANLLEIPFYLGYKRFIVNVTFTSQLGDTVLLALSFLACSGLLLVSNIRNNAKRLQFVAVLCQTATGMLAYAFLANLNAYATVGLAMSAAALIAFLIIQSRVFSAAKTAVTLIVFYLVLALLIVEAMSLTRWLLHLFHPSPVFSDQSWLIAFAEAQLVNVFYPILPAILIFFSYSWVGELTFKFLTGTERTNDETINPCRLAPAKITRVLISVSVLIAIFIGYYNYAIAGKYNPAFPGTDVPHYVKWLNEMLSKNPYDALTYASGNDRFLYLALQYLLFWPSGLSSETLVTYAMPVVLTLLFASSSFLLVRVARDNFQSLTTMLITVFSFQVTVGIYAGFYANWLALTILNVFYSLLVTVLRGQKSKLLVSSAVLSSIAVLYTHPWTWILLVMAVLSAYLTLTVMFILVRKEEMREHAWEIKLLITLLAINIAAFYLRNLMRTGGLEGLVDGYIDVETFKISLLNTFKLKYFLDRTFNWYVGGFYAYAPIILLAIVGVISIRNYEDHFNRLMLTWMLLSSAIILVEFPWQARFLYLTPFNIYASLGALHLSEHLYKTVESKASRRAASIAYWTFYALSMITLMNYAVRCVVIKQFGPAGLTTSP